MRNMSFTMTIPQIKNRTKTVTRRMGWRDLISGDVINACEKCQGLKKGEKMIKLCQIVVVSAGPEALRLITQDECDREGFPDLTPLDFVAMFKKAMSCLDSSIVNRIEFKYI